MRRDDPEALELIDPAALPAAPLDVIAALAPLLTEERIQRIDASVARRTRSVIPVLDAVEDPRNVAAILRSADAFGVQEVHLLEGAQPFLASRRITQGAERWLDLVRHASPSTCVAALHGRGYEVYVATLEGGVAPEELQRVGKVAVVFGNEQEGVGASLRTLCAGRYTIPMLGFAQSLNVSVAAAITLFSATRGRNGDLSKPDRTVLRARFMYASVPQAGDVVREYVRRRLT